MLILATSKIQSNYQTTIPKEIRKNYDIDNETVVEWFINKNGNPEINFRKKRNFKNKIKPVYFRLTLFALLCYYKLKYC